MNSQKSLRLVLHRKLNLEEHQQNIYTKKYQRKLNYLTKIFYLNFHYLLYTASLSFVNNSIMEILILINHTMKLFIKNLKVFSTIPVSQGWKLWLKHVEFYLTATEKDGKIDKVKTSLLLTCIGKKPEKSMKLLTW